MHVSALSWLRKAVKGKRGCRFGCFHIELIQDDEGKQKNLCRKGWPRVEKACFSRLQYETQDLAKLEEFKNENPHVFQAQRDHPFEGMSNPVAQVVMRCNVDVKYLGRAFAEDDLTKFSGGGMCSDSNTPLSAAVSSSMEVHSPGAMRPDASQPVAGVLQPELSEQEPCNMDVTQQDDALDDTVHGDEKRRKMSKSKSTLLDVQKTNNMRMALERVLIDMSRDMQDVGFYTGEYAAKKFEISRSMLPELYAGRGCCRVSVLVEMFEMFGNVLCLLV